MDRLYAFIYVGLGGLAGSCCRYLLGGYITRIFSSTFPYGTFIVNIAGCFLIGIFYGLAREFQWFSSNLSLLLITGFCGGFTTFSSFAFENISLLQSDNFLYFALYSFLSFALGLLAVFAGLLLIKFITQ